MIPSDPSNAPGEAPRAPGEAIKRMSLRQLLEHLETDLSNEEFRESWLELYERLQARFKAEMKQCRDS
jgi:hypothetical protein